MKTEKVKYHLILCATPSNPKCCSDNRGILSWEALKNGIKNLGLDKPTKKDGLVLRTKADCLRVCKEGPILLIWPDGYWYKEITPERVDTIIKEHIINGRPIQEWIFKRSQIELSQAFAN